MITKLEIYVRARGLELSIRQKIGAQVSLTKTRAFQFLMSSE